MYSTCGIGFCLVVPDWAATLAQLLIADINGPVSRATDGTVANYIHMV